MPEELLARLLGEPLVKAIDGYFDARARLIKTLIAGDGAGAQQANRESRDLLATWMALLVERIDGRTAALLVDVLTRLENLESLMGVRPTDDTDDPTGFDAGRQP